MYYLTIGYSNTLPVLSSALKHHISEKEIRYAIAALAEIHPIDDR